MKKKKATPKKAAKKKTAPKKAAKKISKKASPPKAAGQKPAPKKAAKKASPKQAAATAKGIPPCECMQDSDGGWYRFVLSGGRRQRVDPPFDTQEECEANCP